MNTRDSIAQYADELFNYHKINQDIDKAADCIIGLGSYDLAVVDRCIELFKSNVSQHIIFTGKHGNWTKSLWDKTEAEVFTEKAINNGIPKHHISLEKKAKNIGENILLSRQTLLNKISNPRAIIIVTKPNTQRRAFATCKKLWPEIEVLVTSFSRTYDFIDNKYNYLIHEMVGDLQRIIFYPQKGYQIKQEIPDKVKLAYNKLIEYGFTDHLINDKAFIEN